MASADRRYVPALGYHWLTPVYDLTVAAATREGRWRAALIGAIDPQPGDVILDIGCGTGTLAARVKRLQPDAHVIGLDPGPAILRRARAKAARAGVAVDFVTGLGEEAARLLAGAGITKIASSLVLHQVPLAGKRATLEAAFAVLPPGGRLHIADFGLQRGVMRLVFKMTQMLDGFQVTQPNADGVLPTLMAQAGFVDVAESLVVPTVAGSISLYRACKP